MLLRFTKSLTAGAPDLLFCVRADGTQAAEMPREGVLPRLAIHFVVENTLGWRDAVFGHIATQASPNLIQLLAQQRPRRALAPPVRVLQSIALVTCLQGEQWNGASDHRQFTTALAQAAKACRVAPPAISAEELDRLRLALREFGAAWRPLRAGASLEYTFP